MIHGAVAVFVSVWLLLFSGIVLAAAIALEILLAVRLVASVFRPKEFLGSVITAAIMGPVFYMFGLGAWQLGGYVIGGLITRFT